MDTTDYQVHAEWLGKHIDESYDMMVAAQFLTGTPGAPGVFSNDAEIERAADAAVRLRAQVRNARSKQS